MSKVSVLIPSRSERFLVQTVTSLLANARGDIEIVVALDGYDTPLPEDARIRVVHHPESQGMRACINHAAQLATGEYLLKSDAHCLFADGFDVALAADCEPDWMVIPRRYSLDAEKWERRLDKSPIDAHYLSYPFINPHEDTGLHGVPWNERTRSRKDVLIDEEMSTQGSAWFCRRSHWDRLGGMDGQKWGMFFFEFQELGLKTWLGGGACMVNKRTWYAHLHKGKQYGRGYHLPGDERARYTPVCTDYWLNNRWPQQARKFEWLIDRFAPVPTWPENWREIVYRRDTALAP